MQYVELKEQLKDFTIFSLTDIKRIDYNFHRRRLNEWQDKGYISKVIKGYYIFSDLKIDEKIIFEIANRVYSPSYISFEMALSYYGLIPENVYSVTSASTRRTYVFKTKIGEFTYRTIRPKLFFGYEIVQYDNKSFKIAASEKALLDYFYLNPILKNNAAYKSLRIDKDAFSKVINKEKLLGYLDKFGQKTLTRRIKNFLKFMSYPAPGPAKAGQTGFRPTGSTNRQV